MFKFIKNLFSKMKKEKDIISDPDNGSKYIKVHIMDMNKPNKNARIYLSENLNCVTCNNNECNYKCEGRFK